MVGTVWKIEIHCLIAQVYSANAQAIRHFPPPQPPGTPDAPDKGQAQSIAQSLSLEFTSHWSVVVLITLVAALCSLGSLPQAC